MHFIIVCTAALIPVWTGVKNIVTPTSTEMEVSNTVALEDHLISNGECNKFRITDTFIHFECNRYKYSLPATQCSVTTDKR